MQVNNDTFVSTTNQFNTSKIQVESAPSEYTFKQPTNLKGEAVSGGGEDYSIRVGAQMQILAHNQNSDSQSGQELTGRFSKQSEINNETVTQVDQGGRVVNTQFTNQSPRKDDELLVIEPEMMQ